MATRVTPRAGSASLHWHESRHGQPSVIADVRKNKMHVFTRPICNTPRTGAVVSSALCFAFVSLGAWLPQLRLPFLGMAAIFVICLLIFLVLICLNPQKTINITDDYLSKEGLFSNTQLAFKDIEVAELESDFDAENYLCLNITSKDGRSIFVDSRFISYPECEVVSLIEKRLDAYGKRIHKKQYNPNNAIHRMATRVTPPAWVLSSPGRSHATGSHR